MKEFQQQVSDIAGCLRRAKGRAAKCSVLVGAGCSKSAGVPLAGEIINIIKSEYTDAYTRAERDSKDKTPTYSQCMNQLSPAEVHHLIGKYVDNAKLNWAHLGLAQLVEAGFVDRVLTTNFDPLVVRACNLVGVSPSVYDFAASADFAEDMVDGPAVYYLHGQRTGFRLLNVLDDLQKHVETLDPIIEDSCRNRVWIIVGYSGANDAVFQCLSKIRSFRHNLYWVIREDEPEAHLHSIFQSRKNAYYVKSSGADEFFCELANELGCFPPVFVNQPFTHFLKMIEPVMDFTLPGSKTPSESLLEYPRGLLQKAMSDIENNDPTSSPTEKDSITPVVTADELKSTTKRRSRLVEAREALWQGDYDRVLELTNSSIAGENPLLQKMRFDALLNQVSELYHKGMRAPDSEASSLFEQAKKKCQQAFEMKSDRHEALNSWGLILDQEARRKTGEAADKVWSQAIEKYRQALEIKPDSHAALNNWGVVLMLQASQRDGDQREHLLAQAEEKCLLAEALAPNEEEYNFACIAALRGKVTEARHWLEKCIELGELPSRWHLEGDETLNNLRKLSWFEEILQQAPEQ